MPTYQSSPSFEHGLAESLGVLLVNLGTPDAPTPSAVRRYLAEFLWDPRVVELPRALWWLILHGVILRTRPARSARAYQKIWTDDGSPLLLHCQDIRAKVQQQLSSRLSGRVEVRLGMSYGQPAIASALEELFSAGARRIMVLPLYPQYSGTTTGSVFEAVTATLAQRRWVPELRFINHYHDAPGYISALANSIRDHWQAHGRGEKLMFSFHGVPQRTLLSGDPYHCQCQKTARLVAEALALEPEQWVVAFQSRVGREEWLRPYADETISSLGQSGLGKLDVVCPGFSADCLETLEEIAIQNNELFRAAGGGELVYIPALNAAAAHVEFLAGLVETTCGGWPETNQADATLSDKEAEESKRRALAMGAAR